MAGERAGWNQVCAGTRHGRGKRREALAMAGEMARVRVLLVIGSAELRGRVARTLAWEPGIQVLDQTGDPAQGVELARHLRPDLLLCDSPAAANGALAELFADRQGTT